MDILTDFVKSIPHNKTSNNMKPIQRFHAMVPSYLTKPIAKAFDLVNTIWNPFSVTSAKNQLVPYSSISEGNYITCEEDLFNDQFCHQFLSSVQHRKFDFSTVKTKNFENLVANPTPGNAIKAIQILNKLMLSSISELDSDLPQTTESFSKLSDCSKPNNSFLNNTIQDPQSVIQPKLLIVPSIRQLHISVNSYKMEKTAKLRPKNDNSCHNQLSVVHPRSLTVNTQPVICTTIDSIKCIVNQVSQKPTPNYLKDSVNIDKVNCSRDSLNQEMTHRKNKKICKLSKKKRRREKRKTKKQTQNIKSNSELPKQVVKNSTYDEVDHFDVIFDSSSPKAQSSCGLFMGVKSSNYEIGACYSNPTLSFVLGCSTVLESEDDSDCSYDGDTDSVIEDLTFQFDDFVMNGLSSVSIIGSRPVVSDVTISIIDLSELSGELKDVNSKWEKDTCDVPSKPKSPTKVSFASDPDLISVFPVDIYNRKGEWEIYATERMRFKRRIDDVEKVLSPCLSQAHREKIFHLRFNNVINDACVIK